MSSTPPALNTNLQRSLQYYQKGVLQPEAWFRIVQQDYTQLIEAINWKAVFQKQHADFQLLDIGCGTGTVSQNAPTSITVKASHSVRLS